MEDGETPLDAKWVTYPQRTSFRRGCGRVFGRGGLGPERRKG